MTYPFPNPTTMTPTTTNPPAMLDTSCRAPDDPDPHLRP